MRNWLKKQFTYDRNSLAIFWLLFPVFVFVVINRCAPRQMPSDTLDQIDIYQDAFLNIKANVLLENLLDEKPLDIELNYRYLQNNCETLLGINDSWRGDKETQDRYIDLAQNAGSSDLGNYSLGYIESCQKHYQAALDYFTLVENKDLKYLNNSIGFAYKSIGEDQKAEAFFHHEIAVNGYIEGAVNNLVELYEIQGDIQKLGELVAIEPTKAYVHLGAKEYLAFRRGHILRYLELVYIAPLIRINGFAAGFALLICTIWFSYLWRLNLYTREPFYMGILALLAGAFLALSSFILYDLWFMVNPIIPGESTRENFIFFFLHVGFIEEIVKFLPVVIIIVFTRERINEPLDLVILGGFSALGFATLENSLYFSAVGINIASARFIISTFLHMAETMLLCYLWARARYMTTRHENWAILGGFGLVMLSHGLFDFILTEGIYWSLLIAGAQIVVLSFLFGRILQNSIYFSPRSALILTSITTRRYNNYHLLFSAAAVLLTTSYLYANLKYPTEIANWWFAASYTYMGVGIFLVYYPVLNLGFPFPSDHVLPKMKIYIPVNPWNNHVP